MTETSKILIVDDAALNRSILSDMLAEDYEILEATNGEDALKIIDQHQNNISLVLLDLIMPEKDGFEVLAVMNNHELLDSIPVIIISSETAPDLINRAYDMGAVEYINRPFDANTVRRRVKNTVMLYTKQKRLENLVSEKILEKEKSNLIMVDVLSRIVEFRNGESGLHVLHIRVMTETLLKSLASITGQYDLTPEKISLYANASALHDIGKISIPESILNKPGKLTPEEFEIMKTHCVIGAEMLEKTTYYNSEPLVNAARDICRWHHERYDGKGYPDGLRGDEIPIATQVVALADVYDALTNERVYKPAYSHEKAIHMILSGECGAFNPLLLRCLQDAECLLKKEMQVRSACQISEDEMRSMTRSILKSRVEPRHTITRLGKEHVTSSFFAAMSKEIQFEYNMFSDVLNILTWETEHMELPPVIVHPATRVEVARIFAPADYADLRQRLKSATREVPVVTHNYQLTIQGEKRWFKAVVRPVWLNENDHYPVSILGKFIDIHEEQDHLEKLKQSALQDSLTGLYNRDYISDHIREILLGISKEKKTYALMLVDLDHFKDANDRYGHIFGDKVLQEVSKKLADRIKDFHAIAARVGGDEFLVFAEYEGDPENIAYPLFQAMHGTFRHYPITVSMGVALIPKDGTSYNIVFHRADQALYAAKLGGRNRYRFYSEEMSNLLNPSFLSEE